MRTMRKALRHQDASRPPHKRQAQQNAEIPLHRHRVCVLEAGRRKVVPQEGQLEEAHAEQAPTGQPAGAGGGGCHHGGIRPPTTTTIRIKRRTGPFRGKIGVVMLWPEVWSYETLRKQRRHLRRLPSPGSDETHELYRYSTFSLPEAIRVKAVDLVGKP